MASDIPVQKDDLSKNSLEVSTAINKHGEDLHREVNVVVNKLKDDLDEMDSKYLAVLEKHEDEIMHTISDITLGIADLKKLLICHDLNLVSAYKSRNAEFRRLPPKLTVTLPSFAPQKIKTIPGMYNKVIRLSGWKPLGVCTTSAGDLLVTMVGDNEKQQTKVVRYSNFREKQCIQFNDDGQNLYSSGESTKYISENRNLDICVSDYGAHAVVVVNQAGKLRFTYTGPPSTVKESFYPQGIATDSQSRILTADHDNNRIHILDQDGQFLRYIEICNLQRPYGLCVDTKDKLFVAEFKTAIDKTGKDLYSEIDVIIEKLKSNLNEIDSRNLAVLATYEQEITHNISEITESIADLKELLKSNDINIVSSYKSRNALFRKLPPKPSVTLPGFTPCKINKEHISQQFGSLSELFNRTEENDYTIDVPGAEYSPQGRIFLDVPQIITEINTGYKNIFSVACLSDEDLWICGNGNVLKLYNLQRGLVRSYQTKSGLLIDGNAITSNGDPVFIDYCGKTVNLVKNSQRHTIIKQKGWIPLSVCSTSSDNLLVVLASDDIKQETKVVRYSDSTEKQSIQYNDKGKPLYSSGGCPKCINENRNLDICVSDWIAPAVVVVNQAGKLRFTYNGPPFPTMESFDPQGITTDSQSRILIADCKNHYIHILDQDGQFLQFIDNFDLLRPFGLCVDTNDNLFVGESCTGKLKKIQYYL
uniref:Tripartite motif-containing protein 2 n=1 Tax=Magallana gigas TaxID=29159 RepID=K1QQ64_MAGGI